MNQLELIILTIMFTASFGSISIGFFFLRIAQPNLKKMEKKFIIGWSLIFGISFTILTLLLTITGEIIGLTKFVLFKAITISFIIFTIASIVKSKKIFQKIQNSKISKTKIQKKETITPIQVKEKHSFGGQIQQTEKLIKEHKLDKKEKLPEQQFIKQTISETKFEQKITKPNTTYKEKYSEPKKPLNKIKQYFESIKITLGEKQKDMKINAQKKKEGKDLLKKLQTQKETDIKEEETIIQIGGKTQKIKTQTQKIEQTTKNIKTQSEPEEKTQNIEQTLKPTTNQFPFQKPQPNTIKQTTIQTPKPTTNTTHQKWKKNTTEEKLENKISTEQKEKFEIKKNPETTENHLELLKKKIIALKEKTEQKEAKINEFKKQLLTAMKDDEKEKILKLRKIIEKAKNEKEEKNNNNEDTLDYYDHILDNIKKIEKEKR